MANVLNTILALDTTKFQLELVKMQKKMQAFSKQMQDVGTTLTQNVTLPLGAVGVASVSAYAEIEKLNKGLVAIMGSSEAAAAEFEQLREVAKLPGLGLKEAVQGSINLQAVGLSAEEARETLLGFGKALAATGKGKVELESIQYQLTQMISKNKLLAEDYKVIQSNLPLMAAGLREAFGTENIDRIRATGISAKDFTLQLSAALQRLPQTQNVTGGLANAFENLSDNAFIAASEFGQAIATAFNLEQVFKNLGDALLRLSGWFKGLSPNMQKTIVLLLGFAAAIGPILFIIGKLSGAWAVMLTGFSTGIKVLKSIRTAFLALTSSVFAIPAAIVGAIVVIGALYNKFESVRKVVNAVGQGFIALARLAKESFSNIVQGIQQLKEGEFKAAASSFGNALGALNPIELGKTFASGFAVGFQDSTNYLKPTIEGIKKEVEAATKSLTGGGVVAGTGGVAGTGEGGGTAITPKIVDDKGLKEQEIALSNLSARIAGLAQTAQSSFGLIRTSVASLSDTTPEITAQKEALLAYYKQIEQINTVAGVFGDNPIDDQIRATKTALEEAIATFPLTSQAVAILTEEYNKYNAAIIANTEATKVKNEVDAEQLRIQSQYVSVLSSAFQEAAGAMKESALTIQSVLRNVGRAVLKAAADFVQAKIIEAIASVLADSFKKFGLLGAAVGAGAGALVGTLFQGVINKIAPPKLAQGGLAYAPTLAVVGDNRGASVDPEVIAPLSKLKDMLGGGGGYVAEARISGNDLLILVNNAERRNGRIR